ncbi:MAG: ATP-binding protein [Chitinophagaceae bacterium]
MQTDRFDIDFFLAVTTGIILLLTGLAITIFYAYQNKLLKYNQTIFDLKHNHEKNIMEAQLEMQELTFQNIAHEIHDNVIHSISLAKFQVNALNLCRSEEVSAKTNFILNLLSESVIDLNNISKGLNRDLIQQQGLLKAIDFEIARLDNLNLFTTELTVLGVPIFLDDGKELVLFRIIQEAFQNIIKHSYASKTVLSIEYLEKFLIISITDNGKGFPPQEEMIRKTGSSGLSNIRSRVQILNGEISIATSPKGTSLSIKIPYNHDK